MCFDIMLNKKRITREIVLLRCLNVMRHYFDEPFVVNLTMNVRYESFSLLIEYYLLQIYLQIITQNKY